MSTINGIVKMTYGEFTAIPNGTQVLNYYYNQCVALANLYNQGVIGGPFVAVNSAYQWATAYPTSHYTKSSTPVPGAIFVARGGVYNNVDGHIGVVTGVGNGVIYTMEQNTEVNRFVGRATRSATANILCYLIPKNNPAGGGGAIGDMQRQAGPYGAKRRAGASITSAEKQPPLKAGEVGNFKGYVWGQDVNDGNIHTALWYVGTSGDYFWAGGFTAVTLHNLPNLTPVPANERIVAGNPVNQRVDTKTSAKVSGPQLPANSKQLLKGYSWGQNVVDGKMETALWYVLQNDCFAWAGGFTSVTLHGLKDLTPKAPALSAKQRQANPLPVNIRATPSTSGKIVGQLKASGIEDMTAWVTGETVEGKNLWYKSAKGYMWAGAFTTYTKQGLSEFTEPVKPPVTPPVKDENPPLNLPLPVSGRTPVYKKYEADMILKGSNETRTFTRPTPQKSAISLDGIKLQTAPVSSNGYTAGRPAKPSMFVVHHTAGTSMAGAVQTLNGEKGEPTAHYVVQDETVTMMVNTGDTAWTNGRWGMNLHAISFEIVNDGVADNGTFIPPSMKSLLTAAKLMAYESQKWGIADVEYLYNVFLHKEVSVAGTSCPGSTDYTTIIVEANKLLLGEGDPEQKLRDAIILIEEYLNEKA